MRCFTSYRNSFGTVVHWNRPGCWRAQRIGPIQHTACLIGTGCTTLFSENSDNARAQGPVLESAEGQHRAWEYSLGHLATLSLVEAAGTDGPIEFYRLLAPTGTGAGNRWPSLSPWRDAFVSAFGVTVDDFYSSFGETQESLPGRTGVRRQANERVLRGTIGRADDSPVGPVWVTVNQVNSQGHVSLVQRSLSDETGSFELFVPHSANYRIGIELVSDYWCHVWHTDGGITNTPIAASLVRVSTRSVTNVKVVIPDQVCAQRIEGQVFGT